jgi:uncharacterized protein (TIGR04255 family)
MNQSSPSSEPPILEMVICAQFAQLTNLTMGHYGLFWKELGEDWVESRDGVLIDDQFEIFGRKAHLARFEDSIRIAPISFPGRIMFHHKRGDLLLQVQGTRFLLNWRKADKSYPRYENLITRFEDLFARFTEFCKRHEIHSPLLNQWELTYVNSFPKEIYWSTPNDWSDILPGLFGKLFASDETNLRLDNRAAQWSFEIKPERGRLHVNAHAAQLGDTNHDSLLLTMTSRGPVDKKVPDSLREGLDLGHTTILGAFKQVVKSDHFQNWGIES